MAIPNATHTHRYRTAAAVAVDPVIFLPPLVASSAAGLYASRAVDTTGPLTAVEVVLMKQMPRLLAMVAVAIVLNGTMSAQQGVTRYVRFSYQNSSAYGLLEGETIRELKGDLFATPEFTGRTMKLEAVRLLAPCQPSKVIAVGLNYKSHLGDRPPAAYPGLFAKLPTSIVGPGDAILAPDDAKNLHFEGELVVVIGKRAKNVSVAAAPQHVFGVTAGNDVSE